MFSKLAVRDQLITWIDRAIDVQDGALRSYFAQADPGAGESLRDPGHAMAALESRYLATVSGAGAAVGGAASIPGVGTGLAVGLSVAETVAFLDATALFALAAAELRGFGVSDLPRRRTLLLILLLGDDAVQLLPAAADGTTDGWGERLLAIDGPAVDKINRIAEKWLLTRFGPRQGMLVVGRLVPFGIGAAIGAAGNAMTAKGVIARLRTAFTITAAGVAQVPVAQVPVASEAEGVEPPTGKYAALHAHLQAVTDDDVVLPFAALDAAVAGGLPSVARTNASWWGNDPTVTRAPQTRAWLAAGLHVSEIELAAEKVRFTRGQPPATPSA